MRSLLFFAFILFVSVKNGSSECSKYDFPCENGECVDSGLWCDSHKDCEDGSDEKYCKKTSYFNKNPNKCSSAYFKCDTGICIPLVGRCDEYDHCGDYSDERNCEDVFEVTSHLALVNEIEGFQLQTTTPTANVLKPNVSTDAPYVSTNAPPLTTVESRESLPVHLSDSFREIHHFVPETHLDLNPSDYSHQREKARNWILSQREIDFGWGDETARAITALYLSGMFETTRRNEIDFLMVKQLEVQLSLNLARNATKPMELTDLALYINALSASCKDPMNFYGENLVRTLRNSVDAYVKDSKFVNPSVYLTLCLNNASTYEDAKRLHIVFSNGVVELSRIEILALAMLTSSCIYQNTNYLSSSVYEGIKRQFLYRVNVSGFPGNVYEASLIFQAMQELKTSQPGLLEFILRQQQDDGSFGDILATYLVLPALTGRSFLHMKDHCSQQYTTDPAPIEVLRNGKRRKIYVQYSLNYGNPPEITQTIQMKVAEGINFLDVMRLAQEINPKFRFLLDGNREVPVVYSIGGIPNDAEKGMFWTLHVATSSSTVASDAGRLSPYPGSIKKLVPRSGDEFVFWMRSV